MGRLRVALFYWERRVSGTILGGIGIFESVGDILGLDASPIVLGEVTFSEMEVPETVSWGGRQQTVVHRMPGGKRVIDAVGRDDAPIRWSGYLMGAEREERAWQIDQMRAGGWPVNLQWGTHLFVVVVKEFRAEDQAFRTRYTISCEVIADATDDPATQPTSLLQEIVGALNWAESVFGPLLDLAALGQAISDGLDDAQTTVQGLPAVAAGDGGSDAVQASVAVAQTAAQDAQGTAETALVAINTAATDAGSAAELLGSTDAAAAAGNLATAIAQSGTQAAATGVQSFLGRIVTNLTTTLGATDAVATFAAPAPPVQAAGGGLGTTVATMGGNLFAVAAKRLGDATQWYRVAQASGLSDPMLSGLVTLKIPDPILATSDGIPAGANTVL